MSQAMPTTTQPIATWRGGEYSIVIQGKKYLTHDIRDTYHRLKEGTLQWEDLSEIERIKVIAFIGLVVYDRRKFFIDAETFYNFDKRLIDFGNAQKRTSENQRYSKESTDTTKDKIIVDIIKLLDRASNSIEDMEDQYSKYTMAFANYLDDKDIRQLNSIRRQLQKEILDPQL